MGEMLPMMLARADEVFSLDVDHLSRPISRAILDQVWLTTSGIFTEPPFLAALKTFGIDRIMFSVDYPYAPNAKGRAFLDRLSLVAHRHGEAVPWQCRRAAEAEGGMTRVRIGRTNSVSSRPSEPFGAQASESAAGIHNHRQMWLRRASTHRGTTHRFRDMGPRVRRDDKRSIYPNNTASAPFTASALSVTVFSSDAACTVTFSAKKRASVT